MSKRVRTLLRVSSRQQLHDDDIPIQRAEAEQFIAKQKDWVFDKEYLEKGISAYHNGVEDRAVLQEIMQDAKQGEFEILLTYMSDRIGRQEEYSFYVASLNQLGIEVWTIKDGQLKTEEHIDKLLNYIRFWQNEGESKKTGMRVRDTQREMVKAGKFVGGKAPYGYELIHSGEISNHGRLLKKPVIVEEQAEIVRKIYNLAVYKGYGYDKIAKALNNEGIPAITTDKWKAGTIRSILTNPMYMGYVCINRRIKHEHFIKLDRKDWIYAEKPNEEWVIVPQSLWEKAQRIRESRKSKIDHSKEVNAQLYEEQHNIPFSVRGKLGLIGLAYCGYCGKRLRNGSYCNSWTVKSTGEKKTAFTGRYNCPSKCEERSCYSQSYLEDIVFSVVTTYLQQLKKVDVSEELQKIQKQKKSIIEKERKQLEKQLKTIKTDIATLEEKIPEALRGDYFFSPEKLSQLLSEKAEAQKEIEAKAAAEAEKLKSLDIKDHELKRFIQYIPKWEEEFMDADMETKRMILSSLIDKIIVKDDDITIKFKVRLEDFMVIEDIEPDKNLVHETMHGVVPKQGV